MAALLRDATEDNVSLGPQEKEERGKVGRWAAKSKMPGTYDSSKTTVYGSIIGEGYGLPILGY